MGVCNGCTTIWLRLFVGVEDAAQTANRTRRGTLQKQCEHRRMVMMVSVMVAVHCLRDVMFYERAPVRRVRVQAEE